MHLSAQEWFPLGAKWTYTYVYSETAPPIQISPYQLEILSLDTLDGFPVGAIETDVSCNIDFRYLGFKNDSVCFWDASLEKRLLFDLSTAVGDSFFSYIPTRCSSAGSMNYDTLSLHIDSIYNENYNGLTVRVFTGTRKEYNANFDGELAFKFYEYFGFNTWPYSNVCDACEAFLTDLRCYEDTFFMQQFLGTLSCDTSYYITSIRDRKESSNSLLISPNPVQAILQIHLEDHSGPQYTSLEIYNLNGQLVFEEKIRIQNDSYQVEIAQLIPGIYALCVKNDENQTWTRTFVKQ